MSIRIKVLLVLILVPTVTLPLLLFFLSETFAQDKKAYLMEYQRLFIDKISTELSQTLSSEVDEEKRRQVNLLLSTTDLANTYVVDGAGGVLYSSEADFIGKDLTHEFRLKPNDLDAVPGQLLRTQSTLSDGDEVVLTAKRIGELPFVLVTSSSMKMVKQAVMPFIVKGLIILLSIICLVIVISSYISYNLTRGIQKLLNAQISLGSGNFKNRIPVRGKDEVAKLSIGFNKMAETLENLMMENQKKAVIEHEMQTASAVQKKFFPPDKADIQNFKVRGYYESAAQCGGDWWFYFFHKNSLVLCIADVTGHGLGSAFVTAAARAAFSNIQDRYEGPGKTMQELNRSIYDSTNGALQMTCNILEINSSTHSIRYCNASHVPFMQYNRKSGQAEALTDVHGPRLGEKSGNEYGESSSTLSPDSLFLLYTDGVYELNTPKGRPINDRHLTRVLKESFASCSLDDGFINFTDSIRSGLRVGSSLEDDLSYIMAECAE